jgi:hypothetical protein
MSTPLQKKSTAPHTREEKKRNAPPRANQAILSLSLVKLFKRRKEKRRKEKRRRRAKTYYLVVN